ncbi:MAG: LGFP repeat-containing protein, partial [Mycobacterium sp.]|nr:LGFP repeat-containing protein [Mycobacterium sp.]
MLRHRPPTMLFTAIAATVVILPWATAPDQRDQPKPGGTQLIQQPLIGVGGGLTIREVSRPTPFSMVALTGGDLTDTSARVRAKRADGSWGPWYDAETLESGPESDKTGGSARGPRGTEPVFVGTTTTVQIALTRPAGAPVTSAPPAKTPAKAGLGYRPMTVEHPLAQNISAILIAPPQAPADTQWTPPTAAIAPGQPPNIISRSQWGADESIRCGNPLYDNGIRAAVVHHTADGNDYAPQDSANIVRSIYAYHAITMGWCDIAYNALVDKYGQVFEGRAGGIDKAVEGSHTGGFNRDTWAVAMIGNFDDAPPTPIQLRTVGRLLGWRLGLDHVNPRGTVTLASDGGPNTHFPAGAPAPRP